MLSVLFLEKKPILSTFLETSVEIINPDTCRRCKMYTPAKSFINRKIPYISLTNSGDIEELIQKNYQAFSQCPACEEPVFDVDIIVPRFLIVRFHLEKNINWKYDISILVNNKKINLKLVSIITGGTGHATCYCLENDKWIHYNDRNVRESKPRKEISIIGVIYMIVQSEQLDYGNQDSNDLDDLENNENLRIIKSSSRENLNSIYPKNIPLEIQIDDNEPEEQFDFKDHCERLMSMLMLLLDYNDNQAILFILDKNQLVKDVINKDLSQCNDHTKLEVQKKQLLRIYPKKLKIIQTFKKKAIKK